MFQNIATLGLALAAAGLTLSNLTTADEVGCSAASSCSAEAKVFTLVSQGQGIIDLAKSTGAHNTLVAAVAAADLVDALSGEGPLTVFAPTDAAFEALPEGVLADLLRPENKAKLQAILTYHVVDGALPAEEVVGKARARTLNGQSFGIDVTEGTVSVGGANVIQADVEASNGIIHVIDRIMLPNDKDLIDTAVSAGSFTTLATVLGAVELVETLKGEGPFTVFAPTDEAFAKLDQQVLAGLLTAEQRDQLTAILTYHVVPGRISAAQAAGAQSAITVQGATLRFRIVDGQLFVNGAKIISTDIETSNGVIHVIDSVLLP